MMAGKSAFNFSSDDDDHGPINFELYENTFNILSQQKFGVRNFTPSKRNTSPKCAKSKPKLKMKDPKQTKLKSFLSNSSIDRQESNTSFMDALPNLETGELEVFKIKTPKKKKPRKKDIVIWDDDSADCFVTNSVKKEDSPLAPPKKKLIVDKNFETLDEDTQFECFNLNQKSFFKDSKTSFDFKFTEDFVDEKVRYEATDFSIKCSPQFNVNNDAEWNYNDFSDTDSFVEFNLSQRKGPTPAKKKKLEFDPKDSAALSSTIQDLTYLPDISNDNEDSGLSSKMDLDIENNVDNLERKCAVLSSVEIIDSCYENSLDDFPRISVEDSVEKKYSSSCKESPLKFKCEGAKDLTIDELKALSVDDSNQKMVGSTCVRKENYQSETMLQLEDSMEILFEKLPTKLPIVFSTSGSFIASPSESRTTVKEILKESYHAPLQFEDHKDSILEVMHEKPSVKAYSAKKEDISVKEALNNQITPFIFRGSQVNTSNISLKNHAIKVKKQCLKKPHFRGKNTTQKQTLKSKSLVLQSESSLDSLPEILFEISPARRLVKNLSFAETKSTEPKIKNELLTENFSPLKLEDSANSLLDVLPIDLKIKKEMVNDRYSIPVKLENTIDKIISDNLSSSETKTEIENQVNQTTARLDSSNFSFSNISCKKPMKKPNFGKTHYGHKIRSCIRRNTNEENNQDTLCQSEDSPPHSLPELQNGKFDKDSDKNTYYVEWMKLANPTIKILIKKHHSQDLGDSTISFNESRTKSELSIKEKPSKEPFLNNLPQACHSKDKYSSLTQPACTVKNEPVKEDKFKFQPLSKESDDSIDNSQHFSEFYLNELPDINDEESFEVLPNIKKEHSFQSTVAKAYNHKFEKPEGYLDSSLDGLPDINDDGTLEVIPNIKKEHSFHDIVTKVSDENLNKIQPFLDLNSDSLPDINDFETCQFIPNINRKHSLHNIVNEFSGHQGDRTPYLCDSLDTSSVAKVYEQCADTNISKSLTFCSSTELAIMPNFTIFVDQSYSPSKTCDINDNRNVLLMTMDVVFDQKMIRKYTLNLGPEYYDFCQPFCVNIKQLKKINFHLSSFYRIIESTLEDFVESTALENLAEHGVTFLLLTALQAVNKTVIPMGLIPLLVKFMEISDKATAQEIFNALIDSLRLETPKNLNQKMDIWTKISNDITSFIKLLSLNENLNYQSILVLKYFISVLAIDVQRKSIIQNKNTLQGTFISKFFNSRNTRLMCLIRWYGETLSIICDKEDSLLMEDEIFLIESIETLLKLALISKTDYLQLHRLIAPELVSFYSKLKSVNKKELFLELLCNMRLLRYFLCLDLLVNDYNLKLTNTNVYLVNIDWIVESVIGFAGLQNKEGISNNSEHFLLLHHLIFDYKVAVKEQQHCPVYERAPANFNVILPKSDTAAFVKLAYFIEFINESLPFPSEVNNRSIFKKTFGLFKSLKIYE